MKGLGLAIALTLSTLGQSSAQEIEHTRSGPDDPVPAATSPLPRVERREEAAAPAPPAASVSTPPPAPYNVEDARAVIDWLFNRSAVGGR